MFLQLNSRLLATPRYGLYSWRLQATYLAVEDGAALGLSICYGLPHTPPSHLVTLIPWPAMRQSVTCHRDGITPLPAGTDHLHVLTGRSEPMLS